MSHISAVVRLRPIRFAFIVRPDDRKRTLQIFRINTCLWGGQYNPIIPYFRQVPKWWARDGFRIETAKQIISGYLDFFEPDFIVEAELGLADGLGFNKERVLQLAEVLRSDSDRHKSGHGLSVIDHYHDLYRKEYQFVRRNEPNIVNVISEKSLFEGFTACLFGAFPIEKEWRYFNREFDEIFESKEIKLTVDAFVSFYESRSISALRIGHSNIEVRHNDHSDPALFILDASEPRDLIDFWNLRIIRKNIIPIPIQMLEGLSTFCKDFITANHRAIPGNPYGTMIRPTVIFSRSIPKHDISELYSSFLQVSVEGADTFQDWYPSIWRSSPDFLARNTRPILSAGEKTFDIQFDNERKSISFESLDPDFVENYSGNYGWANVVKLNDWTRDKRVATVLPCDYRNPKFPKINMDSGHLLSTKEGLVIFLEYKRAHNFWRLADGKSMIGDWLKSSGISATLSDAGRITQQIIQTLNGLQGVASFAHADIVRLLNKISRTPNSMTIALHGFEQQIHNAVKDDIWRHRNFETLVERGAVELGLNLKCTKCLTFSWYSLRQLDYEIDCSMCLRRFRFPLIHPASSKNSVWAYRLIGPFAIPNYAQGGYSASLSIRFFSEVIGHSNESYVTWSPGQILEFSPKDEIEADFILWYQRKASSGIDYPTDLVFGEAKSFSGESPDEKRTIKDAFQPDDIDRMKRLACRFPGAILVFSTMKQASKFSKDEIDRLTKLAEWGRENIHERQQTRAPVIVLTGIELFAAHSLRNAWKKMGGKHAEIAKFGGNRLDNLRTLADFTQQLYLNMPAYEVWSDEEWKKKVAKRNQKKLAI